MRDFAVGPLQPRIWRLISGYKVYGPARGEMSARGADVWWKYPCWPELRAPPLQQPSSTSNSGDDTQHGRPLMAGTALIRSGTSSATRT